MSPTRALLASATYAVSPGILIVTLLWGQTDGAAVLLVALGLFFAYRRQGIWAGILLALAVGFKPQPAIFLPLALVYLYRWGGWREAVRGITSFTALSVLLWWPYLLPPRFEVLAYVKVLGQIVRVEGPTGSHGAFNLWYLLNAQWQPVAQPLLGPLSLQLVSAILFGLVMLVVLAGIWLDGSQRMLWAAAALLALGFFDVGTLQFERYLTPAVALFLLAAIFDRRYWPCYIAVSVMLFLNFAASIFNCQCYRPVMDAPHQIAQVFALGVTPIIGATINMAALALGLYWYMLSIWQQWKQTGYEHARSPALVRAAVALARGAR
jgi:dolichyl-phosphate-mannose-protein mannosyltransferase